jgi:hypothetical protein
MVKIVPEGTKLRGDQPNELDRAVYSLEFFFELGLPHVGLLKLDVPVI